MLNSVKSFVLLTMLASAVGCGGTIYLNPDQKFPVEVTDAAPAFMFPINLSHAGLPGDTGVQGLGVTAGMAAHFGKKVISGQQLFDLVGNLSFDLAEGISREAKQNTWTLTGGDAAIAKSLSDIMGTILGKLSEANLIPPQYKFKWIVALHSHGADGIAPNTVQVNSWGGLYDIESGKIASYLEASNVLPKDDKSAIATLPMTYNDLIDHLLAGK